MKTILLLAALIVPGCCHNISSVSRADSPYVDFCLPASRDKIEGGLISFQGVSVQQSLDVYAELTRAKLRISPEVLRLNTKIYFTNETMSRAALIQCYEKVLYVQGKVFLKRLDSERIVVTPVAISRP